jgi:Rap1a immunity proteins
MWRLLLLAAILVVPASAAAQFMDGNRLYARLQAGKRSDGVVEAAIATGYVTGVADAYPNCIPAGVTVGQLVDIALQYLEDHPEKRQLPAVTLVATAISEKFPCAPKGSSIK